ncbi:unnamed protein product [Thlaspi arvense]|uniref:Ribosomal protein S13 n=1 Tax=Thlaspi arvense TaxID=13288 RepID=A0AAU9TAQ8_THLAR|nr:unnamed protein product [Thlaspi arvense]
MQRSVIGIDLNFFQNKDVLNKSKKGFERVSNLYYIRFRDFGNRDRLCLPQGLTYMPRKLRSLNWTFFPMTCLPSKLNPSLRSYGKEIKVIVFIAKVKTFQGWEGSRRRNIHENLVGKIKYHKRFAQVKALRQADRIYGPTKLEDPPRRD